MAFNQNDARFTLSSNDGLAKSISGVVTPRINDATIGNSDSVELCETQTDFCAGEIILVESDI